MFLKRLPLLKLFFRHQDAQLKLRLLERESSIMKVNVAIRCKD